MLISFIALPSATVLMKSAEGHSTTASEHHLSKPARNANLEKAATYKAEMKLLRLHAAKNAKSQKTQEVDSQIMFLVYMHYYDLRKHLNAVCILFLDRLSFSPIIL